MGLISAGCGQGSHAENTAVAKAPEKVTTVAVQTVTADDLQETFTLPGTLEAWEDLTLSAEVAGAVRWIGPREGERVRRGEALVRIDPETAQANVARSQADFSVQEKRVLRLEQLLAQKFVSQQEYDEALKGAGMAKADLQRATVALDKSTLLSPVDGVLDRLFIDRGEYVAEGAPVAGLVQVDRLKALVEVPEKDVAFLRSGETVDLLPAAIAGEGGAVRPGRIIHLAYKADPLTRTYLAKIEVDNRNGELRPGMILRARFVRRELPQVIAVPLYAVVDRGGEKAVFVEERGIARLRKVSTGAVLGDRIVIDGGLQVGERLLIKGQQLVADGSKVVEESGARSQVSGKSKPET